MKEKEKKSRGDGVSKTGKRNIRKKAPNKVNRGMVMEVYEISETSSSDSIEESRGEGGDESRKRVKNRVQSYGEEAKTFRFPMNRIRRIMRSHNTAHQIMQDAVFLVNKATEMFMERFTEEAYESSLQDKKKFIHYKHLSSVVSNEERYEFLADCVPEKLRAEVALEQWKTSMADAG